MVKNGEWMAITGVLVSGKMIFLIDGTEKRNWKRKRGRRLGFSENVFLIGATRKEKLVGKRFLAAVIVGFSRYPWSVGWR